MASSTTKRALGFWTTTALVVGNMIGSGIFLLPASLAAYGSIGILAWVVTAVGALLLALVFADLSIMIPKVGGPYAYCREGFGEFVGFQIAYNYWIALWVGNAGIVVALISYLSTFWTDLTTNSVLSFFVCAGIVWFLTLINILSIHAAGIWQLVTSILKVLPLILVATIGFFFFHPEHFTQFNISGQSNFTALAGAGILTLWSFIGLESATVPAESVTNPTKTIPRATIVGTLIVAFVYIISTIALMGMLPMHDLANSNAPYADAAKLIFGSWGQSIIAIGAIISCFGALNGWILLQGQVPYAAAKDDLFPRIFNKQTKNKTPIVGLIVSAVLITLLLLLTLHKTLVTQFTMIILLATLATVVPYLFTAMAEILILLRKREEFNKKRFWFSTIIAVLAGAYSFWAIAGASKEVIYAGSLLFFSSVPIYIWMKWSHSKSPMIAPSQTTDLS
ncbi:MAG: amino acid permease [Gammaproteobacteria bacterium]